MSKQIQKQKQKRARTTPSNQDRGEVRKDVRKFLEMMEETSD